MTTHHPHAWLFALPDQEAESAAGSGLQILPTGGVAMVSGDASVRQALLLLLSTSPGERVMRPSYGCNLRRLVFSVNDDTTAGLAIHFVRQAIARHEPRVEIISLDAGRDETNPAILSIHLEYRVRASGSVDGLAFDLDLAAPNI
jgi:uncharacterized protein